MSAVSSHPRLLPILLLLCLLAVLAGCSSGGDNSPTELIPNGKVDQQITPVPSAPSFDVAPGICYDSFVLTITSPDPSYTVRYTTDNSMPNAGSPIYTEPLPITAEMAEESGGVRVVTVRARCFDKSGRAVVSSGGATSASYLFPTSPDRFTTKVISVVTDPTNLYGSRGILDHYEQRGRESERPVSLQIYDIDGSLLVQQEVGMRIFGTGSRPNAQKNFRIFARKDYSPSTGHLNYPLFSGLVSESDGKQIAEFNKFLIRGGASNFHNTMITNLIAQEMMEGSSVMASNFEPTAMFLNGQYYGMMMLMEDYDCYSMEEHYGADENLTATMNYGFCDAGLTWHLDDGVEAEFDEWWAIWNYMATTDFSDEAEYEKISRMIDIDNFIEYTVLNCYINNWDWPRNNQRVWRYTGVEGKGLTGNGVGGYDPDADIGLDGRWRFVLKDLDVAMGTNVMYHNHDFDYHSKLEVGFFEVLRKDRGHMYYDIYKCLMRNSEFRRAFYLYVCEFMSTRGSVESFLEVINRLTLQISDEMKYHADQFGDSPEEWDFYLDMVRTFAVKRPAIVLDNMAEYIEQYQHGFTFTSFTLEPFENGSVFFNGATFEKGGKIYALLKEEIPFTALPAEGYEVDEIKVSGGYAENGILYLRSADATVTVTFRRASNAPAEKEPSLLMNEIGSGKADAVNGSDWIELYNPTEKDISLKGYVIKNGADRFTLGSITVPAGGFKLLFADGSGKGVYLPFTLSEGDEITLLDKAGQTVDSVKLLMADRSTHLGRIEDGGEWRELSYRDLTPAAPNRSLSDGRHYYHETVRHAILINGVLLPKELITVTEDGDLTVKKEDLLAWDGVLDEIRDEMEKFLSLIEGETVSMRQALALAAQSEVPPVYYVPELDSYLVHVYYGLKCRFVDNHGRVCGDVHL